MLKFLTHKLRTHSINEDNFAEKADENHDSGTESDDEIEDPDFSAPEAAPGTIVTRAFVMSERMCSVSPADTGCSMESPAPDQHDPHSSEEELEVINSPARPPRASSVCLPEKRKWSQVGDSYAAPCGRRTPCENEENVSRYGNLSPPSPSSPSKCCSGEDGVSVHYHHCSNRNHHHHHHHIEHSGSSDEEVHNLLASMATPVKFRTSPPLEALKPGGRTPNALQHRIRSTSPPAKLLHYEVSPRKRSRHTRHTHVQRPYLDFEKMQQLKAHSVTTWRHPGEHGGELSVFCW